MVSWHCEWFLANRIRGFIINVWYGQAYLVTSMECVTGLMSFLCSETLRGSLQLFILGRSRCWPTDFMLKNYTTIHTLGEIVISCLLSVCFDDQWARHHWRDKTQTNQAWLLTSREMCSVAFHTEVLFSEIEFWNLAVKPLSLCIIETCKKENMQKGRTGLVIG